MLTGNGGVPVALEQWMITALGPRQLQTALDLQTNRLKIAHSLAQKAPPVTKGCDLFSKNI